MSVQLQLLGGFRLAGPWAAGQMAVDWERRRLWMVHHVHEQTVAEYDLPHIIPSGTKELHPEQWPLLYPEYISTRWWPTDKPGAAHQYCNGLWYDGGVLWAVCRAFYDMDPSPELTVHGADSKKWTVPLPQQRFSGWVKFPYGQGALFGCGGYESGQGTCSGPTLADSEGNVSLQYDWLESPGEQLEHWNTRAPRLPDYEISQDTWLGWKPRLSQRGLEAEIQGRWASDFLYGGGVILPEQNLLCYFPYQGTGELRYSWNGEQRTQTFARDRWHNRTRLLVYDLSTMEVLDFSTDLNLTGPVCGQDVAPDGTVWLTEREAWGDGGVLLRAYRIGR